jgi:hypothetical protein
MYLALFLTPWMLVYTLSTLIMNHRDFVTHLFGGGSAQYEKERELAYNAFFSTNANPKSIAAKILSDLYLSGSFSVQGRPEDGRMTIVRHDPITPRRIVFFPQEKRIVVEREIFQTPAFLVRLHHRKGFIHDFLLEDAWALSVDVVITAMIFWVFSGLWMWWELQSTRRWGVLCLVTSWGIFGFFLFTI